SGGDFNSTEEYSRRCRFTLCSTDSPNAELPVGRKVVCPVAAGCAAPYTNVMIEASKQNLEQLLSLIISNFSTAGLCQSGEGYMELPVTASLNLTVPSKLKAPDAGW